ncbi:hypothetical protein HOD30_04950 [Candidatus Peregrinibacteria bacterium]|jgi:hypothetical protein|nr:hypothetical protein [Candidatus Peregrinibacteria bacterium]MBT4631372.1 hypothetical protein [Candidatus Peregrinibacteria bacterium]MBT5517171.1 hypothetical protein [Candidatus Peregrinibacteria bacterium]MBT5823753.1 hypothetical protein [Candidatus Peregrinibacteria bacterium]
MTDDNQGSGNYTAGFSFGDQGGSQGGQGQDGTQPGGTQPAQPVQPTPPVQPIYQNPTGTQPVPPAPVPTPAPPAPAPVPAPIPAPAPMPAPPAPPVGGPLAGITPPAGGAKAKKPIDPNYLFGSKMKTFTTTVVCPAHQLNFDEAKFINLLAGSISLTKDEKKKIVDSIPKLRQEQVDELIRIFDEERAKFIELSPKHGAQLEKLEAEHAADWKDIELMYKSEVSGKKDEEDAEAIRKQLGL